MNDDVKMIRACSIWHALDVIGDTATLLILEASLLGSRRFDEFHAATGLRRALLSDRLKRLVSSGLAKKVLYSESPVRHEYRLTDMGKGLLWSSLMMLRWEQNWSSPEGKCEVKLFHKTCGHVFKPIPMCLGCGKEVTAFDVSWAEGPGVGEVPLTYSRRRQLRGSAAEKPVTALMDESAQVLGDRWASLVIRALFTGMNKFDEILADSGMATNILSERLAWLQSINMIRQHAYSIAPLRYEYRLTRKGVDYYNVLVMLLEWGDKHFASLDGPPLVLRHKGQRAHKLKPAVCCSACSQPLKWGEISYAVIDPAAQAAKPAARQRNALAG